jgi:cephalosporin-C deacetylase-like acetyl esterase
MQRTLIETDHVAGVPLLTILPEGATHCPIVFALHGFRGDKAEVVELGYRLASAGIACISLDAAMHGNRWDDRLAQVLDPTWPHVYPFASNLDAIYLQIQIVEQTAADINRLITHIESDERFDTTRLGVTGVSMGGLISYYLAANHPKVTTAVPIISVPNFTQYWDDLVLETMATEQGATALASVAEAHERNTAFIRRMDPSDKLPAFAPKPLLMQLGNTDINAPKAGAIALYRQLRPYYAAYPDRLQLRIYANTDHRVTREMIADACDWFRRYLHPDAQRSAGA